MTEPVSVNVDKPILSDRLGSRPIPDPTELTDRAITRVEKSLTQYIDGQLGIRDERLAGIDQATKLLRVTSDGIPDMVRTEVSHLELLHEEKFESVGQRFTERDIRSEREARDNKVAVDAAFAAQKEAAAKQDEANAKAIDKSERSTAETIKTNQELSLSKIEALTTQLNDLKLVVSGITSQKVGATESRTSLYAAVAAIGGVVLVAIAVIGAVLAAKP